MDISVLFELIFFVAVSPFNEKNVDEGILRYLFVGNVIEILSCVSADTFKGYNPDPLK